MRLVELFLNENYPKSKYLTKLQSIGKEIGNGAAATVRKIETSKREGEVIKIPHNAMFVDFSNDPYVVFVRTFRALQAKGYKNPYLPEIIDFQEVEERNGTHFYYARIEHLYPETTIDKDSIEQIKQQMFHNYKTLGRLREPSLDTLITDAYERNAANIKDIKLAEALDIIREAEEGSMCIGLDLQGNKNHMFRNTGGLPELVITDPLS